MYNFLNNNAFLINSGLLKLQKWIGQLVGLLKNSKNHIEFYSKLFIRTKNRLKNEMIKLIMNFFCETLTKW